MTTPPGSAWLLRSTLLGSRLVDVRIADGHVVEIGPDLDRRKEVEVVAGGRRVLPGLRDGHVHFQTWALERRHETINRLLARAPSAKVCAEELAGAVAPGNGLVRGTGFRQATWPDAPDRSLLDALLPGRPVVLSSQDVHSSWWSSAALALVGLDHPDGHLREHESWDALAMLPPPDGDEADLAVEEALRDASARGVTAIVDYEMSGSLDDWQRRARTAPLPLRVTAGVMREQLDRAIDEGWRTGVGRDGILVGPLKLFSDGALGSRSAWCDHAYVGEPGNHGMALASREELAELVERAWSAGIVTTIHAIGDAANRTALGAFADAGAGGRIEHAQLLDVPDLARFARLGVTASVQPGHAVDDRDLAERWWADRLDRAYPLQSLKAAGARLVLGSDAPVSPLDPWRAIAAAVARTLDDLPPWLPEQALSLDDALAASTDAPLTVGGPADLILVDEDPWHVAATDLADIPVWATMVDGRWTHHVG